VSRSSTPGRRPVEERGEEAIGGYTIFNDWSARDLQPGRRRVSASAREGQGLGLVDWALARHP
jgi:2-keto-4-pentenoate hydratase/2-oxohepta-3-ene-1,7-dioic acid hydratase in catechol pathway